MLNVLSIDVEDYYHVEAFASRIPVESWESFVPRVEQNVERVLGILRRHGTRGTFFVLGWVAERFPAVVREILEEGHEIGCHGFCHRRLHGFTPERFRADLRRARQSLADAGARDVVAYRAPSFSIVRETSWAFDILVEEGFRIDSSVFPVMHDLYGIPDAQRFPHWRLTSGGQPLFEFPASTVRIGRRNWGVAGGGYLRILPYALTRWAIRRINGTERQPAMVYVHPWEIDAGQPRIPAGLRSRMRHYTNLRKMEGRLNRLLHDYSFATLSEVCRQLEIYRTGAPEVRRPLETVNAAAPARSFAETRTGE